MQKQEGVKIERTSDIFCGCGTVALEAKKEEDMSFGGVI